MWALIREVVKRFAQLVMEELLDLSGSSLNANYFEIRTVSASSVCFTCKLLQCGKKGKRGRRDTYRISRVHEAQPTPSDHGHSIVVSF